MPLSNDDNERISHEALDTYGDNKNSFMAFRMGAIYEQEYQQEKAKKLLEAFEKIKNGTWNKEVDYSEGYMSSNAALIKFAEQTINDYNQ